jgi:drug/metabolite transporter (DMT)-like permease
MGKVFTCLPEVEALPAKTQAIGFGLTGLSYRSCAIPDQGLHLTSIVYTVAGTLGVLLGLFFIAIPEAEERIPASLASLMTCIIPISTFLIATLILRWEKFAFSRLGGGFIALAGVAMFIGLEKIHFGVSQVVGVGIMFFGFVVYAVFLLYARACQFDPYVATTGTMVYVTLLLAVAAFALEQPLALRPGKEVVLVTVIMGVLSTGAAYAVLNYLIVEAGVVFASTMGYFIPVFAIVTSYFLVGDSISWLQVAGLGLTLVGAWLVNRKPEPVAA